MSSNEPESNSENQRNAIFEKFDIPFQSPVVPQQYTLDDEIQFRCRPGIACFNECCKNIDIVLTPYDIVRLSRHLNIPTWEFLLKYSMHYDMDAHGMPGIKMRPSEGSTACQFMTENGCSVYQDRPTACRYYAMGTMGIRRKDSSALEDVYFLVKEPHCLGHAEDRTLSVRAYRQEQQVEPYDDMNREWLNIIVKKRSSGPTVGAPSERSFQLFALASYDLDAFREFTQSDSFQSMFDLDAVLNYQINTDDEALINFAMRFLKQVLFGERSLPMKAGASEKRYQARKEFIEKKHKASVEQYQLRDPREFGDEA